MGDLKPPLPQAAPRPEPAPALSADQRLRKWMAENLLRDSSPATMAETLATAGFDRDAALATLAALQADPVFIAARRVQQGQRKLEAVAANLQRLWERSPGYAHVEKREAVPTDEFLERYVAGCRPVVITGLARGWPALQRWRPLQLKADYGHLDVAVQRGRATDPDFERNKAALRRTEKLGDFIDSVLAAGASNDMYMTANDEVLRRPEFAPLLRDIGPLPYYCDASALAGACSLWLGPAGTLTPLHHDTLMLFHTQIVGRKRWRFISPLEWARVYNSVGVYSPIDVDAPDLARFPAFAGVKMLEVVVEPGETVFLPLGWWHQVASLDVSVSLSFTNLAVPNQFTYPDP
jgi:hypothetical protein